MKESNVNFQVDESYLTHQKFLKFYTSKTTGDILELGVGFGSTPLLKEIAKSQNRKLVSVDNNLEWINKMKETCPEDSLHTYIYTNNWCGTISDLAKRSNWSIVFIDQHPWEARAISLYAFREISDYVIVHDVDYFPKITAFGNVVSEWVFDFSKEFTNWKVYYPPLPFPYPTGPPTLVGTNRGFQIYDFENET